MRPGVQSRERETCSVDVPLWGVQRRKQDLVRLCVGTGGTKTEREPRQSMHSASGRKTVGVAPCTRVCLADLADAHALVLFSARMSGDGGGSASYIPSELQEAVLLKSVPMPADSLEVKGHDFSEARAPFHFETGCLCSCAQLCCLASPNFRLKYKFLGLYATYILCTSQYPGFYV